MIQIVYISSPKSQEIYVWKLNALQENLELIQIITHCGEAQPIAIHPNKQFLYIGVRPIFGINTYSINKEGLLGKLKTTKILISPTYLTINNLGTFLYCASYNYNSINTIAIDNTGIPSNKNIQTIKNLWGCHSVKIDQKEKFLWAPCLKDNSIRIFNINHNTGILTQYKLGYIKIKQKSGPRHIVFHHSNNYAYVINELNGTITVITYNEKKIPTIVQTVNIFNTHNINIKNFWSSDIHITPNNCWLYCTDRFSNTISCFKILTKTNQLKFMRYQNTEIQPRGFAINKTGDFLIVAGQKSHYISLYRIDIKNGKLNIISRYASGLGPMWVRIVSLDTTP